jgi:hypothetical protein
MKYNEILDKCEKLHESKSHDYTTGLPNENFKRSAHVAGWFQEDRDKAYVVLIATKLARLASLLGQKEPKNESVEDTFLDLVNYCALWAEDRTSGNENQLELPKV